MVRPKRFELLAYRFVACCSIQLSYERMSLFLLAFLVVVNTFFRVFSFLWRARRDSNSWPTGS